MKTFLFYFLLFIFYSIIGWIVETLYVYINSKKLINRGFLIGPVIPIYGTCSIIMILYLNQYKANFLTVFILALFICTFLEYITSFFMEKIFNARWWDYSNLKFNINGRVCLKNSILFGILSLVLIYFLNPIFINILNKMNQSLLYIISLISFIIFITDLIISCNIVFKIRSNLNQLKLDATIEIKKLINETIKKKNLHSRIFNAFPRLNFFKNNHLK